jgi:flagellar biosynthetic protein FliR
MNPLALSFDPLAPGAAATLVLTGARVGGLVLIAPVFSSTVVPRLVRVGLLIILTVLIAPVAFAGPHATIAITAASLASETLIGVGIGLGAAVIVGAAETAGDIMAVQMGLSGSAILNPLDSSQLPVLGVFGQLFAVTVLLSLDFHHTMLRAVADSFQMFPVGGTVSLSNGLAALTQLGGALFVFGVRFAAPVIAVILIANVALAVLGRAAPQLNLLSVSFPVQIALGLITLGATLPAMARSLHGATSWYQNTLIQLSGALAAVR